MSTRPPSRVVFVGNIPYGLSEEQITDIFSRAGKVLSFRLVYDRDTGKPKGFGFAEYPDADSAASAVRNLNGTEIMGRNLRVDFSNEGSGGGVTDDGPASHHYDHHQSGGAMNGASGQNGASGSTSHPAPLPSLPPGKDLPAGVSATDAISRTLRTLPPAQLLDILQQMKIMASTDPARATELLTQAPQLSYAIFQALLLMELVSPDAIHSVVDPTSAPPPATAPPPSYGAYPAPGVAIGTPPVVAPYAPPTAAPTVTPVPVPPPAAPIPTPAPAAPTQDADELMRQVMALPQAVIDQLPEAERAEILKLRATFMAAQQAVAR